MDGHPPAVVLLQSLLFLLQPLKQAPAGLPAPSSPRPALTSRTHQLYLRTQGSASLLRTKKMNTPLLAGTQYSGRLTCGPTKLMGTEGFVNLVNMYDVHPMAIVLLQTLVFLLQPPKAAPVVPPAPSSRGRLCYRGGLTAPILLPPLARPSLHSPTPLLFCGDGSLTPEPNQ